MLRFIPRSLVSPCLEILRNRRRSAWYRQQVLRDNQIHRTLEVTGREDYPLGVELGSGCIIERDVTLWISPDEGAVPQLKIGDRVFVGRNTYLGIYQPISVGNNTIIGAYCYIISANHRFESREVPIREQGFTGSSIHIAEDVWIGTHVVILPGVQIGRGAMIAAGGVVNRDIGEYEIWGGMPARFIKKRP